MSHERRRDPRASERVALTISDPGGVITAETKNLSASGAYCTLERFIAPMTKLQLQFELPDGPRQVTVRCDGVVVRIDPVVANPGRALYNVAIFFSDLGERERSAISRFVRGRLSAASPTD